MRLNPNPFDPNEPQLALVILGLMCGLMFAMLISAVAAR